METIGSFACVGARASGFPSSGLLGCKGFTDLGISGCPTLNPKRGTASATHPRRTATSGWHKAAFNAPSSRSLVGA